ncbi:site-specific integrase [Mycobacterium marseillense]|nr:tyrosine-type recombinase/integrase [Mycobacterium marseillense]
MLQGMATRRGNSEGTFYVRPDGRVEGRLRYTDPQTGRRKRLSVYASNKTAARAKLKEAATRLDAGAPPKDADRTVGGWLTHWRATTLAASDRKESTRELYSTLCRLHLEPVPFGSIRLDRLRPTDIEALILAMRAKTKPGKRADDGTDSEPVRALSDSTIRSTYTMLRAGLDGAVRDGLLARNPAALVRRPSVERTEAKHLDTDAVAAVRRAAQDSRYHGALTLIASTGLRRGECLELKWSDIDLDAGVLVVRSTLGRVGKRLVTTQPKTTRSRREVPLHPAVVTSLRKHRIAQLEDRLRAANKWQDSGLVFTTELRRPGRPAQPAARHGDGRQGCRDRGRRGPHTAPQRRCGVVGEGSAHPSGV